MHALRADSLRPGVRIPELRLVDLGGSRRSVQGTPRDACVLLWIPAPEDAWAEALRALAAAADDIEQWYAHIVVIVRAAATEAAELRARAGDRLDWREDPKGDVARELALDAQRAALVIADRYRQVYFVAQAEQPHELPDAADIEEWTRYLATQCPECGVIDEPGHGEWSAS